MATYNNATPYKLDMQWRKGDKFTFLNQGIKVYENKECNETLNVADYDGRLEIRVRPQDDVLAEITTSSGDMVFTDNVITFEKVDLDIKVNEYYYVLLLIDKSDTSVVGSLLEGRFNVIQ